MKLSFFYVIDTWIIILMLLLIMVACIVIGRRWGKNNTTEHVDNPGNTAMTGALYALLGLMLAFTFSMSAERFKARKALMVEEANDIGTAILRTQLYPDSTQALFKAHFRDYLTARLRYFDARADTQKIRNALNDAARHSEALWKVAAASSKVSSNFAATNQMIPALNNMFDIANSRFWGELDRTPASILTMLFVLAIASSFTAGYTSKAKGKFDWSIATTFCLLTAMVIFFIIDLDKPRKGVITVDSVERAIVEVQKMLD